MSDEPSADIGGMTVRTAPPMDGDQGRSITMEGAYSYLRIPHAAALGIAEFIQEHLKS